MQADASPVTRRLSTVRCQRTGSTPDSKFAFRGAILRRGNEGLPGRGGVTTVNSGLRTDRRAKRKIMSCRRAQRQER